MRLDHVLMNVPAADQFAADMGASCASMVDLMFIVV